MGTIVRKADDLPSGCPSWCVQRHGDLQGEDDTTHVSGELRVHGTSLYLCSSTDPVTHRSEGPFVLFGTREYTLHQADALIDALTQLVDEGEGVARPERGVIAAGQQTTAPTG